jgi:fumarate reductase flavoprotein subunit
LFHSQYQKKMQIIQTDLVIVGAGGAGLRAAIAAAEKSPDVDIQLISKVYPMRSHTVAAEGGSAGVAQAHDSLENHFRDTVAGGDWLCDQDVVDYFVSHATEEMVQLEHWGCPWSRMPNGDAAVRAFGGMKIERTWFAADKTGFHMLHTLFQTSMKLKNIHRLDEFFMTEIIMVNGRACGVHAIELKTGKTYAVIAKAVILATGGAGRVFRFNTNGAIVTGDGMAAAYRAGAALRDMEFVQYHPTGLPGSGVLITEGARGEGGILLNKHGRRYLQDYGLGPETPPGSPKNKYMELGPRDRLSQAFWQEQRKGNTIDHPLGDCVHLDMRHLGKAKLEEKLPLICSLARNYIGVEPADQPIPVRPAVHYTMGGIRTNIHTETDIPGLYAAGECASVGMHGANRLGSNSLCEIVVFGKVAGEKALELSRQNDIDRKAAEEAANAIEGKLQALKSSKGDQSIADIRKALTQVMERDLGIYRLGDEMERAVVEIAELRERARHLKLEDNCEAYNTELLLALELQSSLEVAESMAVSAVARKESRGAHQRLDGFEMRDDDNFLKHSITHYAGDKAPELSYQDVNITRYKPAARVYGAEAEEQEKAEKEQGADK